MTAHFSGTSRFPLRRLMCLRFAVLTIFILPFATPIASQTLEPQFDIVSGIQYCTGGGRPLLMDVFIPAHRTAVPTPAILWIHTGGWAHGDKSSNSGAQFLANNGFVTASLTYRLSDESPFPAAIEDCKCAIRFLRANASKYGIDPDAIGVAGSSAGGQLAELVATADRSAGLEGNGGWQTVSSKVQAAAAYSGISDFTTPFPSDTEPFILKLFRGTKAEKPESYRKASPLFYVSANAPPLLLAHGEKDDMVPFDESVRMAEAYRRFGVLVELIAVKDAAHEFAPVGDGPVPSVEVIHQRTADFFKRSLAAAPAGQARQ